MIPSWVASLWSDGAEGQPKTINLNDQHAVKRHLDEFATEIFINNGFEEDVSLSNIRIILGLLTCGVALVAQFYPKKFPENKPVLIICIVLYVVINVLLQYIGFVKEKNHILFTLPRANSVMETGLAISSKMARYCPDYTLEIASVDPASKAFRPPVAFTKSATEWFTADGSLVEDLFCQDVLALLSTYENDSRKTK